MNPDESRVSYDVRDLLERIDSKLDTLSARHDARYDSLDARIREIELHGSSQAVEAVREIEGLRAQVAKLGNRIAYATGGIAVAVFVANVLTSHSLGHI